MKLFNKILLVIFNVLLVYILFIINKLNVLPNKYLIPIVVVFIVVIIIINFLILKFKKYIFNIIFLIITIIINIFIIYYLKSTDNFLSSIKKINEKSVYYIITNKSNNYKLENLENKNIGILSNQDSNYNKAINKLNKLIKYNKIDYNSYNNINNDLTSKISSLLINSSIYEYLVEEDILNNTKIIKKIYINLDKKNDNKINNSNSFSIFISGIDTYGDINKVSRSDVNIVATINIHEKWINLTSIPRDSYVKLHRNSKDLLKDKLTHAGIYGIDESVSTVEDLLNINIDYYIRLNFSSLTKLIDDIGGIDVYSDYSFTTKNGISGVSFNKGFNHLNGREALAFARERKSFSEGDRQRGKNQEKIIEAIIKKISESKTILLNYNKILNNLSNSIETNIGDDLIKKIIKDKLESNKNYNISTYNINGVGKRADTYSMPGISLYVMEVDYNTVNEANRIINNILHGTN